MGKKVSFLIKCKNYNYTGKHRNTGKKRDTIGKENVHKYVTPKRYSFGNTKAGSWWQGIMYNV